jgi:anti-sigma-K factor RskA
VERESIHELTAAYALDALDPHDERDYEEHLRVCESCRSELSSFRGTAATLAYAVAAPAPPAGLRERIMEQARAERSNVVPLGRRWVVPTLGAVAAVAAAVAIGLGIWAASLHSDLSGTRSALSRQQAIVRVLADPNSQAAAIKGAGGTLVVAPSRQGVLAISNIAPAPSGKTYEAWVIKGKTAPKRAGLFARSGQLLLTRPVPKGALVAVTVEKAGGVNAPTQTPHITAQA